MLEKEKEGEYLTRALFLSSLSKRKTWKVLIKDYGIMSQKTNFSNFSKANLNTTILAFTAMPVRNGTLTK